jgi:RNA polymerase sigma-70 factor (ECF subfamily)
MPFSFLLLMMGRVSQDKFLQVYYDNRDIMFTIANAILENAHNAEEAVQEAFLKIALKMSKNEDLFLSKSCEEIGGLCGIVCRGCAIDIYRKHKSQNAATVDVDDDTIAETVSISDDVVEKIVTKSGYDRILSAISEMKDTYRDVLTLKFVFEYSNDEIAKLLGINKRTVEMRVFRGKNILAEKLREGSE